jgi:hypothetical protein
MPSGTLTIPWQDFSKWLKSRSETRSLEVSIIRSGGVSRKDLEEVSEGKRREKIVIVYLLTKQIQIMKLPKIVFPYFTVVKPAPPLQLPNCFRPWAPSLNG